MYDLIFHVDPAHKSEISTAPVAVGPALMGLKPRLKHRRPRVTASSGKKIHV